MSQAETPEGIMVASTTDLRDGNESRLLMTALAELRGVMAIAAIRLTRICGTRVAREKSLRVIARLPGTLGAVTFKTGRAHVAGFARHRAGARFRVVPAAELPRVIRWRHAGELRARCAPRARCRQ